MLLALWTVGILGFFALSPFKLPHYGLPAFPAMALLVAKLWDEAIERPPGAPRSSRLLVPALLAMAGAGRRDGRRLAGVAPPLPGGRRGGRRLRAEHGRAGPDRDAPTSWPSSGRSSPRSRASSC